MILLLRGQPSAWHAVEGCLERSASLPTRRCADLQVCFGSRIGSQCYQKQAGRPALQGHSTFHPKWFPSTGMRVHGEVPGVEGGARKMTMNLVVTRSAGFQACRSAGIPACRLADLQVCLCNRCITSFQNTQAWRPAGRQVGRPALRRTVHGERGGERRFSPAKGP